MKTFRAQYYDNDVAKLSLRIYGHIRQSFMGGIAEVYKPQGETTYVYDINSLYPYIMKTCAMPCGPRIFREFDKNTNDDFRILGFTF